MHPILAEILSEWHREGFDLQHCTKPKASLPLLPRKGVKHHTKSSLYKMWRRACLAAGVDNRSLHSTRHTFTSLTRRGGARKDVVERITHNAKGDIVDEYTTWDWAPLCEVVLCLNEAVFSPQNVDANVDADFSPEKTSLKWWRRRESKPGRLEHQAGTSGNSAAEPPESEATELRKIPNPDAKCGASQQPGSVDESVGCFSAELSIWDAFDAWELAVTRGDS